MIQALYRGILGVVIGLVITIGIALIRPAPWSLRDILAAVGLASFCAAFFSTLAMHRLTTSGKT